MDTSWRSSADMPLGDYTSVSKDKWSDRIAAWDKLISDESRKQADTAATGAAAFRSPATDLSSYRMQAMHTGPRLASDIIARSAVSMPRPVAGMDRGVDAPAAGLAKPVGDELDKLVGERFIALGGQIRELIDREWQSKVPEIEFGIKEKHAELKDLFDKNTRTALTIGDKVLEVTTAVDLLKSHERESAAWKRDMEQRMKEAADGIDDMRAKGSELRVREGELAREREDLRGKLQALDMLKDEQRTVESRLETYVKEEIRCSERRQEVNHDTVLAKVRNVEKLLQEESDGQRVLGRKLQVSEDGLESLVNELAKTKGKLGKYVEEVNDQGEDLDELRNVVKQMEQSTRPGYCQGCRLVSQDVENKLFSIKQSICYLDQTLKGSSQANAAPAAPEAVASPRKAAPAPGVDPGALRELEGKVEYLEASLANLTNSLDQMKLEIDDIANPAHIPNSIRTYIDEAIARSEEHVLDQVKYTLDLWSEAKARKSDVEGLEEQMIDVMRRLNTVEDKLE